jgi:exodeoxyribonuclease VII large subunit
LIQLHNQLKSAANAHIYSQAMALKAVNGRLHALSPAAVLERGYSITRRIPDQCIVRDAAAIKIGELVEVLLAQGIITCRVEGKSENAQENI